MVSQCLFQFVDNCVGQSGRTNGYGDCPMVCESTKITFLGACEYQWL